VKINVKGDFLLDPELRNVFAYFHSALLPRLEALCSLAPEPVQRAGLFIMLHDAASLSFETYLHASAQSIPFITDSLSSAYIAYGVASVYAPPRTAAQIAFDVIEGVRADAARRANERRRAAVYDVYIPAVFGAILGNCRKPDDIPCIIGQMRKTKGAKAFRSWAADLDRETDLRRFNSRFEDLQDIVDGLAQDIESPRRQMQLSIGALGLGIQTTRTVPARLHAILERIKRLGRPHLSFLLSLCDQCFAISSLAPHLTRVFGVNGEAVCKAFTQIGETLGER
jgi:hypothetical protein